MPPKDDKTIAADSPLAQASIPPAAAPSPTPDPAPAAPEMPTIGRIVRYALNPSGESRPALVVRDAAPGGLVNLHVFLDGNNDDGAVGKGGGDNTMWLPSVAFDAGGKPGTWHWPPPPPKKKA